MSPTSNVFIIGSCVSRDAFAMVPNSYRLVDFISRSSFGSGFAERPFALSYEQIDPQVGITSQFQRNMVQTDLVKGLPAAIAKAGAGTLFLVDLIDERFSLMELDGTLATGSVSILQCKPLERFPAIRTIPNNSKEHLTHWEAGLARFAALAAEHSLPIVLNKAWWATEDVTGTPYNRKMVGQHNDTLARMYERFEQRIPCKTITYPDPPLGDPDHKWGRAPFHYTLRTYEHMLASLDAIAEAS